MEIVNKNIHQEEILGKNSVFFTLDEDFNVPDMKPDMEVMLRQSGDLRLDMVRAEEGKAVVTGQLEFAVMYQGKRLDTITGTIDFSEKINMDGLVPEARPECNARLEDLTVKMINSRKINVKAVAELSLVWEEVRDVVLGSEFDEAGRAEQVQMLSDQLDVAEIKVFGSDSFRIKEDIPLPNGKPNIARILWKDISLGSLEYRMQEDSIRINGEIKSFVIYEAADEESAISWMEMVTPFEETLSVSGCQPEMIGCITPKVRSLSMDAKTDGDGEMRILVLEAIFDVHIKAYEESQVNFIRDLYVPMKNVSLSRRAVKMKKLAMKNSAKCRLGHRGKLSGSNGILSICNVSGKIRLQMTERTEEGIEVNGMVDAQVFYVTANDKMPWESAKMTFPFTHVIECRPTSENISFEVDGRLEDISCVMIGNDEIEIKGIAALNAICFEPVEAQSLEEVEILPMEDREYMMIPGMIGYIAGEDETLWDIAKKNHTTCEKIKSINKLSSDRIKCGDKLLLIKAARG